ncbi:uncharacterized protein RHIMIDRAFT_41489 [Rhizopus microsporus ATCC 52813]|uniref:SWIM-type domain-containing protein n=1 Tax=Rhizopus microsporus ATCC 52813 TaxID=1340429 RepID=A0A2G4SMM4_RHIZD|nr:uncharacterized protein RHIMIDRAFT_41489 [Rhizopus microsporus ATCC 52813]PHZ09992.1 hypothetical protein RHIMIDRAFT_41489 [Rhizopus microsporus ATCC 52813]
MKILVSKKYSKKISHKAFITIREGLSLIAEDEDMVDFRERAIRCNCRNRLIYNLPCRHSLAALQDRFVKVKDVSRRWRMISEANSNESVASITMIPIQVKKPEPWMKYVTLLESAFRACDGNSNKMKKIVNGVEDVLSKVPELKHTLNENPDYVVADSHHLDIMSPKAEDVNAPGRPRKARRFTSLKKDFSKAKFRALYALYGKRVKARKILKKKQKKRNNKKRKIDDVEEESKNLIEETSSGSRAFLKSDYVYDAKSLFEKNKKGRIDISVLLSTKRDAVLYTFDLKGDGWCDYRAATEMVEKNENMFSRVKEIMLHAFEEYKSISAKVFCFKSWTV